MTTNLANLSLQQLQQAVAIKEKITALEAELNQMFGLARSETPIATRWRKRKRSADVRARMAVAQKARWAKRKGKPASSLAKKGKGRRKMSAKARARLSANAKARWAKARAAGRKSL